VTAISFLLGFALLALYWQKRKLGHARAYLHELNQEMSVANKNLQDLNLKLTEANFIKEEYIGQFLSQCSAYIDKLEAYQKKVHKLLVARQLTELQKQAESSSSCFPILCSGSTDCSNPGRPFCPKRENFFPPSSGFLP
jgi:hypothetical protein